jgi:hypothetical protein
MDYKDKYLKYKQKYLNLLNSQGGKKFSQNRFGYYIDTKFIQLSPIIKNIEYEAEIIKDGNNKPIQIKFTNYQPKNLINKILEMLPKSYEKLMIFLFNLFINNINSSTQLVLDFENSELIFSNNKTDNILKIPIIKLLNDIDIKITSGTLLLNFLNTIKSKRLNCSCVNNTDCNIEDYKIIEKNILLNSVLGYLKTYSYKNLLGVIEIIQNKKNIKLFDKPEFDINKVSKFKFPDTTNMFINNFEILRYDDYTIKEIQIKFINKIVIFSKDKLINYFDRIIENLYTMLPVKIVTSNESKLKKEVSVISELNNYNMENNTFENTNIYKLRNTIMNSNLKNIPIFSIIINLDKKTINIDIKEIDNIEFPIGNITVDEIIVSLSSNINNFYNSTMSDVEFAY